MQFRKSILFLSLIGFILLSSSAFALQYGDYTYTVSSGTVTITGYTGTGGAVVIPDTIDGMSVVGIGNSAFYNRSSLTGVTIPISVTSIAESAFWECDNLTSIVVDPSNAVYSSQDGVLYNKAMTVLIFCPQGKAGGLTIPNSVTSIADLAFYFCSKLTSVNIPNSVTSIGEFAFEYCSGLTSVNIPDSVTSIEDYAFLYCTGLTSVTIGNSVTSIGDGAFAYCSGLTKAYFLGNAPTMGSSVFYQCSSNFSICYTAGSTGFTTPRWCPVNNSCYPASVCGATLIELSSFTATPKAGKVIIQWSTESEIDNAGFNLYRSEIEDGEYTKINTELIPAQGSSTQGANYEFIDAVVQNRKTYYYKLEDIDLNGKSTMHGPVSATPRWVYGMK